jgi:hypothetical protein
MRPLPVYPSKTMLIVGAVLVTVLLLIAGTNLVIRLTGGGSGDEGGGGSTGLARGQRSTPTSTPRAPSAPLAGGPAASSVAAEGLAAAIAQIGAAPAVRPAVSARYPAITGDVKQQPDLYAKAFVTELFTTNFHTTRRVDLLHWAQYESAPYRENGIPAAVGAKMLLVGLSDAAGDDVAVPPILPAGPWLSLGAQHGYSTVSNVKTSVNPDWQSKIASGHEPVDPQGTWIDVSAMVTLHTMVSGHPVTSVSSVSLTLILATSVRGFGYAAASVLYYVTRSER